MLGVVGGGWGLLGAVVGGSVVGSVRVLVVGSHKGHNGGGRLGGLASPGPQGDTIRIRGGVGLPGPRGVIVACTSSTYGVYALV